LVREALSGKKKMPDLHRHKKKEDSISQQPRFRENKKTRQI
jgi:hypothetical protein